MKSVSTLFLLCVSTMSLWAQSKNPITDVLREALSGRQKNTVGAFETMPADKFDYKPTPDQMTFGHLAAHISDGNYFFCSNVGDVPRPKTEELKGTEGKEKLLAAMQASFDFCKTALEKAEDSRFNDPIQWFDGKPRPRAWAALALASSWADHYATAAMYLRLNGLLPPTAQKPKAEEKKPDETKK
jgi:DinB superfamily